MGKSSVNGPFSIALLNYQRAVIIQLGLFMIFMEAWSRLWISRSINTTAAIVTNSPGKGWIEGKPDKAYCRVMMCRASGSIDAWIVGQLDRDR